MVGADYSVPPAFVARRAAVRVSPTTVRLLCEGTEIAVRRRSFVPARSSDELDPIRRSTPAH